MEPTTSESEHDGGVSSGEDNSFEHTNVSNSGHCETEFADQNGQVPYRTTEGAMITSSYLPFMMQQSYQSAVQDTSSTTVPYAVSSAFFFDQNSLAKAAEGLTTTGSPLNLQTAGGQIDGPRIPSDFSGASVQRQQQQHGLARGSAAAGVQHARAVAAAAHQPVTNAYATITGNSLPGHGQFPGDVGYTKTDSAAKLTEYPPPPKRPLTPYMRFNKFVWEKVKASNPSMGVCEISATIGRLWRELGQQDKQRHQDEYTLDKARYDEELKVYLKTTGLRSCDLVKQKPKKCKPQQRRPAAPSVPSVPAALPAELHQQPSLQNTHVTANHQQQQQLQALMGLPASLPLGMPVNFQNMGMLGGFPQMWATAAGQQYAGGLVNEFYGAVNGVELPPPPAHSQQLSTAASSLTAEAQSSALYRYPQSFM